MTESDGKGGAVKQDTLPPTKPLTVKSVYRFVKGINDPLGEYFGELLELSSKQLRKLLRQEFKNADEEFKAYITEWLEGEKEDGDEEGEEEEQEEKPRWRRLVWALDMIEVVQVDEIRQFAEPHEDPTFTVENLTSVLNLSPLILEDWDNVWSDWSLSLPRSQFTEINRMYKKEKDKNEAAAKYLVEINPNSSWLEVARELYDYAQFVALDELQKYLPSKDSSLTVEKVCEVMEGVEGDRRKVWGRGGVGIPPLVLQLITERQKGSSKAEITVACAEKYVKYDPDASWAHLKAALTSQGEQKALEKVAF